MAKETVDNDSTKKQLGFEYQKLIALESCLNAKKGEHVYIECFGDIQQGVEATEVKHHLSDSNLTSNSTDVWKTLKNLVEEYDKLKFNDRFILHTTQNIKEDSIFFGWNSLSKSIKYKRLNEHNISSTSKPFKDVIIDGTKSTKDKLLNILEKFVIYHNQPKIEEKLKELEEHSTFSLIHDQFKRIAIWILQGYLTDRAIENSDKWEINITDFKDDLRDSLGQYAKDYTPFPIIHKDQVPKDYLSKGYKFIEKLENICLKRTDLHQAFQDYVRSEEAYKELLIANPGLEKNLLAYESDIQSEINTEKSFISYSLTLNSFLDNTHLSFSRNVYFNSIRKSCNNIRGVNGTEKYYRDGRIHNITETTDFEWQFKETDLE
ncbi:hypothetical protein [Sphingobacterium siyangense]|uniref:hypothetical protein n=1 Tax=Sphingobacterium siyangense TaxID=459529 RepID=UPI003DA49D1F